MRLSRYGGNPNIGVFAAVNENLALIACDASPEFVRDVENVLDVKSVMTTVAGSFVVGTLVAMNSYGAVVSGLSETRELDTISKLIPTVTVPDRHSAAGNNILINDNGAVVNPEMGDRILKDLENILGVDAVKSSIAGCNTVGSVCVATNKGCLCNANASDDDVKLLEDVLKVEVKKTSINHGADYIGAGILANSKGALIGDLTTPIEMGKIEDGLVLY